MIGPIQSIYLSCNIIAENQKFYNISYFNLLISHKLLLYRSTIPAGSVVYKSPDDRDYMRGTRPAILTEIETLLPDYRSNVISKSSRICFNWSQLAFEIFNPQFPSKSFAIQIQPHQVGYIMSLGVKRTSLSGCPDSISRYSRFIDTYSLLLNVMISTSTCTEHPVYSRVIIFHC